MNKLLTSILALVLLFSLAVAAENNDTDTGMMDAGSAPDDAGQPVVTSAGPSDDAGQEEAEAQAGNAAGDTVMEQTRERIQDGTHEVGEGQQLMVQTRENNRLHIEANGQGAETALQLMQENEGGVNMLKAQLSNGKNAEIKVMPDTASEKAMEQLRLKNCNGECEIELKEVGSGEQVRAAYEVKAQKQAKILGIFGAKMNVEAQVDAETGNVMSTKRPWWSFMARVVDEE